MRALREAAAARRKGEATPTQPYELREARGTEALAWITSHTFRKIAATTLDEAALSARLVADQLGHSRPSMTQDVYMGRRAVDSQAALALEVALRDVAWSGEEGGKSVSEEPMTGVDRSAALDCEDAPSALPGWRKPWLGHRANG